MAATFLAGIAVTATAAPTDPDLFGRNADLAELGGTVNQILAAEKDKSIANMTVGDVTAILDRISIAQQNYLWVKKSERASMALPGLGQYLNGDTLNGTLYLSGDLLLLTGTVLGAYFLLPGNLQFGTLNYFTDSYATIRSSWEGHSFVDYLPSLGVLLGGTILHGILRHVSSEAAGKLAIQRIRDGRITFEPEPMLVMPGAGSELFRFGMRMDMRY